MTASGKSESSNFIYTVTEGVEFEANIDQRTAVDVAKGSVEKYVPKSNETLTKLFKKSLYFKTNLGHEAISYANARNAKIYTWEASLRVEADPDLRDLFSEVE